VVKERTRVLLRFSFYHFFGDLPLNIRLKPPKPPFDFFGDESSELPSAVGVKTLLRAATVDEASPSLPKIFKVGTLTMLEIF
jgi:hypothetical protein